MWYPEKNSCPEPKEFCFPVKFKCVRCEPIVIWRCCEKEFPVCCKKEFPECCEHPKFCHKEHKKCCFEEHEEHRKCWEDWDD